MSDEVREFLIVSAMSNQSLLHSRQSKFALECRYGGTEYYDLVVEFTEQGKLGSYVDIGDTHLLFRTK